MQFSPWNIIIQRGILDPFQNPCFHFLFYSSFFFILISDKIATASFDKTSKLWSVAHGSCLRTFYGHTAEVVATEFSQSSTLLVSASLDFTARIYDVETGVEIHSFLNHGGEVIAAHFDKNENIILTGSFDSNAYLWDLRTKE